MSGLRPPQQPRGASTARSQSSLSQDSRRSDSSQSNISNDSGPVAGQRPLQRPQIPFQQQQQNGGRPSTSGGPTPTQSITSLANAHRYPARGSVDGVIRSNNHVLPGQLANHRLRQHSQGFFEPSLPHTSVLSSGLSASQIAAQAAMHNINVPAAVGNQERKRSHPGPPPISTNPGGTLRRQASDLASPQVSTFAGLPYSNGSVGGNKLAATTAANVVFPGSRSPLPSPGVPPQQSGSTTPTSAVPPEKEGKGKTSKMKLFAKPKNLTLSKDKEGRANSGAASPGKMPPSAGFLRANFANSSTASLVDSIAGASSLYSSANASTSTLVPTTADKDKEKKLNFLTRSKHKLREESATLDLSSVHSNSQATNPDKPEPLYKFTPDATGSTSLVKSMSEFNIRHGGRRGKKEEKTARPELIPVPSTTSIPGSVSDHILGLGTFESNIGGPPSGNGMSVSSPFDPPGLTISSQTLNTIGAQMGLPGIGPDDAWPLLKARLLNIFSGESLRTPIEDFNALVSVHARRCIMRRTPLVLVEDVRELLQTGFSSLAQTLRNVSDDRLVTNLVELWSSVYGAVLPFLQAVFLPLELEFKGRGNLMTAREAQEFWSLIPEYLKSEDRPASAGMAASSNSTILGGISLAEELEIRRIALIAFRDTVIIPKHENLMNIFSRLSLDSMNAAAASPNLSGKSRAHAFTDPGERPDTAGSLSPRLSSYNSQASSALHDAASSSSGGGGGTSGAGGAMSLASRSRATSNTSAGSFGTNLPHFTSPPSAPAMPSPVASFSFHGTSQQSVYSPVGSSSILSAPPQPNSPPLAITDPAKVTETVARMLQCLYVIASCQTGDVAQGNIERLTGALKYNWLGRGRTGRDRRGWVGMKAGTRAGGLGVHLPPIVSS